MFSADGGERPGQAGVSGDTDDTQLSPVQHAGSLHYTGAAAQTMPALQTSLQGPGTAAADV